MATSGAHVGASQPTHRSLPFVTPTPLRSVHANTLGVQRDPKAHADQSSVASVCLTPSYRFRGLGLNHETDFEGRVSFSVTLVGAVRMISRVGRVSQ